MPNKPRIGLGLGLAGRTGFATVPLFDPATLSPYLWNRAEDVTKDGSGFISAWDDLAGNGNYLQTTIGNEQPQQVSGIPGLAPHILGAKFDGVDDIAQSLLALGLDAETEFDIYTVTKFNTAEAAEFNIGVSNGGRWYRQSDRRKVRIRTTIPSFITYTLDVENTPKFAVFRNRVTQDGGSEVIEYRVNDFSPKTTIVVDGFFDNFAGKLTFGTGIVADFDGWLFDIIIMKRHLTPVEEDNLLQNYFFRKYGI